MKLGRRLRNLPRYLADLWRYRRMPGAEPWPAFRLQPMLEDRTGTTGFDAHYVYLGAWSFRHIAANRPGSHVDIGAQIGWVSCLAAVTRVVFIDIRPFTGTIENLESRAGTILGLPFRDREVASLSCLHVAEHIGLGRYGDAIDPLGTRKAIRELARVLAPGGRLYFAVPVGRAQVCFNAHRVHDPRDIREWFTEEGLVLEEFAGVDDRGTFTPRADLEAFRGQCYGCGMFLLRRPDDAGPSP